jgi:hypothetical protein
VEIKLCELCGNFFLGSGGSLLIDDVRIFTDLLLGPLFDDPDPPNELPGICPGLWDYEVVELFFANGHEQYVEIEVGPHGHWLVYLHEGVRKPFNKGEELELNVQNTFEGNIWR